MRLQGRFCSATYLKAYTGRVWKSTFPGETFRVLKEKELRLCGEYRTKRLVLETWERLKKRVAMR